jgi:hypothetical protein
VREDLYSPLTSKHPPTEYVYPTKGIRYEIAFLFIEKSRMKKSISIALVVLLLAAGFSSCTAHRIYKPVGHRAVKHVSKPPMTILDFSRRGCGCK